MQVVSSNQNHRGERSLGNLLAKALTAFASVAVIGGGHVAFAKDPLPLEPIPSYYGWQALWEQGTAPSEDILLGTWKYAGAGAKQACRKFALKNDKDEYSQDGIKLKSGEYPELSFGYHVLNTPSGSQTRLFGYKSKNFLGEQGPYKYRAEAPQISLLVKSQSGHSASDSNISLSCRYVRDRVQLLVCASSLSLSNSNMWNQEALACAAEAPGFFLAWVKENG